MSTPENGRSTKVLVALDGSPAAATALPSARTVAAQLGADVEILHVRSAETPPDGLRHWLGADGAGLARLRIEDGEPVPTILRSTDDPAIALVVLTTHGRAVEPGRDLGHVAEAVIRGTTQPILLIRPEAAAGITPPAELRHLLVPFDGTPTTAVALRPAAELARRLGASVDLLHVAGSGQERPHEPGTIGAPRYVDQPQHEWPPWTAEVVERLGCLCAKLPPDVPVRAFLVRGDIGPQIARFAADRHIDAIVLARRSHLEPGRAQALRAVVDQTPCPILLVGVPADASL